MLHLKGIWMLKVFRNHVHNTLANYSVNSLYHGNLCIFIFILLKHNSRHNLTNHCHPQVKLIGKGSGRSFTRIPLCLNSGPFVGPRFSKMGYTC